MLENQKRGIERELDIFLGKKLQKYREKLGWTLTEMADRLGVPRHKMPKYERADARITASMLFKLAEVLEIKPTAFYEGFQPSTKENLHN